MKVKFLKDYDGWITEDNSYKAGDVAEVEKWQVRPLLEAEVIVAEEAKPNPKRNVKPRKK